jgi:hypothetical protein
VDVGTDTGVNADVSVGADATDNTAATVDVTVETPPLDPFDSINQNDEIETHKLPVV